MSKHAVQTRTGQSRASLYDEITNKIIVELEAARVPWVQPWGTVAARCALPAMPMAAALSANHLAAILLPPTLRGLYIARDADAAPDMALAALTERVEAAGIEALALSPRMGDFHEDLRAFGLGAQRAALRIQFAPQDVVRLMLFAEPGAV